MKLPESYTINTDFTLKRSHYIFSHECTVTKSLFGCETHDNFKTQRGQIVDGKRP